MKKDYEGIPCYGDYGNPVDGDIPCDECYANEKCFDYLMSFDPLDNRFNKVELLKNKMALLTIRMRGAICNKINNLHAMDRNLEVLQLHIIPDLHKLDDNGIMITQKAIYELLLILVEPSKVDPENLKNIRDEIDRFKY